MTDIAVGFAGRVVVIENCALNVPAATMTIVGTAATDGLELDNATVTPPCGAAPFSETLPVTVLPPWINVGILTALSEGGSTLIVLFRVVTGPVAEIVLTVEPVTGVVVMLNKAVVAPAGTVTVCGTAATAGMELNRETFNGAGALELSVTELPCATLPPMAALCTASQERSTGFKVSVAFAVDVETVAEIATVVVELTGEAEIVKLA